MQSEQDIVSSSIENGIGLQETMVLLGTYQKRGRDKVTGKRPRSSGHDDSQSGVLFKVHIKLAFPY